MTNGQGEGERIPPLAEVTSNIIILLPPMASMYENYHSFFFFIDRETETLSLIDLPDIRIKGLNMLSYLLNRP